MAFDVFAHAVFGVVLSEAEQTKLNKIKHTVPTDNELDDPALEDESLEDADHESLVKAEIARKLPGFVDKLRNKYRADVFAGLHYSGDEDSRVGCCHTAPGLWILGYGVMAFPRSVPKEFQARATWLFWVEGS